MSDEEEPNAPVGLMDLPDGVLQDVLLRVGGELPKCRLINRAFNTFITTDTPLVLAMALDASNLLVPPSVLATTPAATILSTLRERLTRFRNIAPASTFLVELEADEGRLYEYLEGVLLRGSGIPGRRTGSLSRTPLPSAITVYDLTVEQEWETIDVHTGADTGSLDASEWVDDDGEDDTIDDATTSPTYKRRRIASAHAVSHPDDESDEEIVIADGDDVESYTKHKWFPDTDEFPVRSTKGRSSRDDVSIKDIAMDPGNDLFLICDERIFLYASGASENSFGNARIVCWNWHTGQKIFEQTGKFFGQSLQTIEDFLLLSSNIFATSVFSADRVPDEEGEPFDHATYLVIYGLVHSDRQQVGDKRQSSHDAVELMRFELPSFNVIPGITMRADPPPRPTFPKVKPLMMYPKPETGLILLTFDCGFLRDFRPAYYTLFILKETLLGFIPAQAYEMLASPSSDSTLRDRYRPPATISFEELSPYCRLKNDIEPQNWVTFIYHYRFVSHVTRDDGVNRNPFIRVALGTGNKYIRLNDFDPVAARKVMMTRKWDLAVDKGTEIDEVRDGDVEGEDEDGVDLVVSEDVIEEDVDDHVSRTYRTGSKVGSKTLLLDTDILGNQFPYVVTRTQKAEPYSGVMIDDSRIVTITEREGHTSFLEVLSM
ncbi:hypothetical protein QFC21_001098 [Naganishia friedmannii]|uniref:Uncharacterized protein n=1 Tax=Naganishia friedmannii TaxID=89922 RepID=A0ACC2W867_9TREE|nr:hypothetical protein QFC21_001098 [Naganishia friedmannii]